MYEQIWDRNSLIVHQNLQDLNSFCRPCDILKSRLSETVKREMLQPALIPSKFLAWLLGTHREQAILLFIQNLPPSHYSLPTSSCLSSQPGTIFWASETEETVQNKAFRRTVVSTKAVDWPTSTPPWGSSRGPDCTSSNKLHSLPTAVVLERGSEGLL